MCDVITLFTLLYVMSEKLYKWPTAPFVNLNFTDCLIDFMFFSRQYQLRNGKRNARLCCSAFSSCTALVPVCSLLWLISIWHSQHNNYRFILTILKFGNTKFISEWRKITALDIEAALEIYKFIQRQVIRWQKYRPFIIILYLQIHDIMTSNFRNLRTR
jgi:hypothetical protein